MSCNFFGLSSHVFYFLFFTFFTFFASYSVATSRTTCIYYLIYLLQTYVRYATEIRGRTGSDTREWNSRGGGSLRVVAGEEIAEGDCRGGSNREGGKYPRRGIAGEGNNRGRENSRWGGREIAGDSQNNN